MSIDLLSVRGDVFTNVSEYPKKKKKHKGHKTKPEKSADIDDDGSTWMNEAPHTCTLHSAHSRVELLVTASFLKITPSLHNHLIDNRK